MSFKQQLTLILIDKLIFGLLLAITAYLASRALENYKKQQALAGEIAKQRVQKMAEVWERLSEWDFLVEELIRKVATVAITQHPEFETHFFGRQRNVSKMTPASEVSDALEVLKVIIPQHYRRNEDFGPDWQAHITPMLNAADGKARVVGSIIRKNQFWLGMKLYSFCRDFEKTLDVLVRSFSAMDLDLLPLLLAELEHLRKDVPTILKEIE